jgi:hypothetical protein
VNYISIVDSLEPFLDYDSNVLILSGTGSAIEALSTTITSDHAGTFLYGRVNDSVAETLGPSPAAFCYKKPQTLASLTSTQWHPLWSRLDSTSMQNAAATAQWLEMCGQQVIHSFGRRKIQQLYAVCIVFTTLISPC